MRRLTDLAPVLLAFAAGAFVVALAFPQFWGGIRLFWHERTLDNIAGGPRTEPVTASGLADAVASWRAAVPWLDDSAAWTDYGEVLVAAARAAGADKTQRRRDLDAADGAYRAALARDPANSRAWTMLAATTLERDGTPEQIIPLLRMSLRTGRREPGLALVRLDIAFYLWRILDPGLQAEMVDEVKIATINNPRELAQMVRRHYLLDPVRSMLADDPALRWRFDSTYLYLFP